MFCCSYETKRDDTEAGLDDTLFHYLLTNIMLGKFLTCVRAVEVCQRHKTSISQSNLVFVKRRLNKVLLWVGLHKEPSLKARLELFATNITVLEMRWQCVPNVGCRDAETARTITRGPSTWYNHVIVVSRAKPRTKGNRDDRWTDDGYSHMSSAQFWM